MRNIQKIIEEDLKIAVGVGATYCCGSDAYPYYVSEVLPNGVIGMYEPHSHFEHSWADGDMVVDKFDPSHKSEFYIRRSYGHWWQCTLDGKRTHRWHRVSFGHAYSYRDPSW